MPGLARLLARSCRGHVELALYEKEVVRALHALYNVRRLRDLGESVVYPVVEMVVVTFVHRRV